MRKICIALVILLTSHISSAQVTFFSGTLDEACTKAREANKQIFIDFYTDWCGPCKAVAKNVFPTEEAGKYFNAHFINMSIDAEKGIGPKIAEEFKIDSYPTFIILNPDKSIAARWMGASTNPTPEKFINIVKNNLETGRGAGSASEDNLGMRERPAREKPGIQMFEGSYADALAKARAENKMVFVDCYTQWCGPCKIMDAEVFPRRDVGDFMNSRFVFLKLDMETDEGRTLNQRFRVRAYPTYILIDAKDNEISRFEGYMQPDAFIAKINGSLDKSKSLEALQPRYDKGERDKVFMRQYIAALSAERKHAESAAAVAELMSALTGEEKFMAEHWDYWTLYNYAPVFSPNFDFLVENQFKFKIGKNVVTDYIVNMVRGAYSGIAFDQGAADAKKFAKTNDLVKNKLDMEYNPTIELYRAAANARVNGDTEGMVKTYEKYGKTILDDYSQRSFLIMVSMSFPNLTPEQRKHLASLTSNEQVKQAFSR